MRMVMSWENLVKEGYVIAGSPQTVIDRLNDLSDNLRIGHLMCGLQMGNMPREKVLYNTQMFAERVAPHLRSKFSEYEDHWYPKMLPQSQRATPIETPYTGRLAAPLPRLSGVAAGGAGA
jgi:hypothetical protein